MKKLLANRKLKLAAATVLFAASFGLGAFYGKHGNHPKEQATVKQKPIVENIVGNKAAEKSIPKREITPEQRKLNEQLLDAVMKMDVDEAKHLLDNGADLNGGNSTGCPFLTWAAWNNDKEMVLLLIEKGVDVNAEDAFDYSALDIANTFDKKEIVELLKGHGAK